MSARPERLAAAALVVGFALSLLLGVGLRDQIACGMVEASGLKRIGPKVFADASDAARNSAGLLDLARGASAREARGDDPIMIFTASDFWLGEKQVRTIATPFRSCVVIGPSARGVDDVSRELAFAAGEAPRQPAAESPAATTPADDQTKADNPGEVASAHEPPSEPTRTVPVEPEHARMPATPEVAEPAQPQGIPPPGKAEAAAPSPPSQADVATPAPTPDTDPAKEVATPEPTPVPHAAAPNPPKPADVVAAAPTPETDPARDVATPEPAPAPRAAPETPSPAAAELRASAPPPSAACPPAVAVFKPQGPAVSYAPTGSFMPRTRVRPRAHFLAIRASHSAPEVRHIRPTSARGPWRPPFAPRPRTLPARTTAHAVVQQSPWLPPGWRRIDTPHGLLYLAGRGRYEERCSTSSINGYFPCRRAATHR